MRTCRVRSFAPRPESLAPVSYGYRRLPAPMRKQLRIPSLTGANAAAVEVQADWGFFASGPASDKMLRWQILQRFISVQHPVKMGMLGFASCNSTAPIASMP